MFEPQRLASREKYAVIGMRLPLVVSRDLRRIRIEWDQVPTVDELIERGERMFTDPDSVAAELESAWIEVAAHAGGMPPQRRCRPVFDRPMARIMAIGHGANDHQSMIGKSELLLSVAVPGCPRFGYRFTNKVPRKALVLPGVRHPRRGRRGRACGSHGTRSGRWTSSSRALRRWPRSPDTPRRSCRSPPAAGRGPGASDPLDDLKRLGRLRDAGILTEAEFAVEKARRARPNLRGGRCSANANRNCSQRWDSIGRRCSRRRDGSRRSRPPGTNPGGLPGARAARRRRRGDAGDAAVVRGRRGAAPDGRRECLARVVGRAAGGATYAATADQVLRRRSSGLSPKASD